jgi:3-oxoacyl-[acyl-carrier protein] reductase
MNSSITFGLFPTALIVDGFGTSVAMIANYIECELSEETMELRDATVLVTGGSSGIGKAIARSLVDAGSKVAINGSRRKALSEAAHALNVLPIRADVSNEADVARTYEEVFKNFGHLDVLVNNAGKGIFKPLLDMQRADFDACSPPT